MPDPLRRRERLRHIRTLDPRRDHYEIYRLCAGAEFPWDFEQALSLALFRTFCVPSISGLLAATGEFERRAQKRYDDTKTLMAEVVEHGYDSPRGRTALRMVNRMHGRYPISNEDMLYVLSTFVYEPVRWIARYGWRPMSRHEELAGFHFYREVGRRMGIRDVPDDYRRSRSSTSRTSGSTSASPRPTRRWDAPLWTFSRRGTRDRCAGRLAGWYSRRSTSRCVPRSASRHSAAGWSPPWTGRCGCAGGWSGCCRRGAPPGLPAG